MYREMVYRVYRLQYTEENALTGVKFLYYGAFLSGSVAEKSFRHLWLPVRFSGLSRRIPENVRIGSWLNEIVLKSEAFQSKEGEG
jgi:hypothetical protein